MNKTLFLLLFGLLLITNKSISQVSEPKHKFDLEQSKKILKEQINKILMDTGIPSVSLSLIKGDTIIWSEAFGFANVKKKVPATSSTIYSTGSNFKFVTATAIMQLVEAGKLDIDDPINKYLGESPIKDLSNDGTPVTFRHLLSHHSGLTGPIEIIPVWERKLPKTLEKFASEISTEEPPGINYQYCNHCYGLAGLIIEKVSGMSYQDYIVDNILIPLQIESKGPIVPTPSMIEELALPYSLEDNQPIPEYQSRFDVYPAGDAYLTSPEMANFYIAQLNQGSFDGQSILNSNSVTKMQEPQFGSNYGFGIGVVIKNNTKYLTHTGGVPGFSTCFKAETDSKTGIYIAANAGQMQIVLRAIGNLALELLNGDSEIDPLLIKWQDYMHM
ncbi:serine hydrolase domain-containing protein [Aquimarina sp. 2304DJ70-9]|uniref:serine hydrolase domain-containing protein n=1 Tax=Aquimarina penaris TaxID=3231044 RepID=UPI003461E5D3